MKYFNGLNMGEGIAGPSTIGMATTVTYSCMGIAFVNTALRFGGLYHYPAEALGNANVRGTIVQMSNDIWPDQIVLMTSAKPEHLQRKMAVRRKRISPPSGNCFGRYAATSPWLPPPPRLNSPGRERRRSSIHRQAASTPSRRRWI